MWKYSIKKEVFEDKDETTEMYYVAENFGECGYTSYESAGIFKGESRKEVKEMLALALLNMFDNEKDALVFMKKVIKKFSKPTDGEINEF